jgi:hypothetical protein
MEPAMAALSPMERPDELFVELAVLALVAVGLEFMVGVRESVRDDAVGFAEVEGIEIEVCLGVVKGLDGDEAGVAFDSRKDQR